MMRVFSVVAVILLTGCVGFSPTLDSASMLKHAERTTVRLMSPADGIQGSGVVLGERDTVEGCTLLVGTARHVVLVDGKESLVTLGTEDGPANTKAALSKTADVAVVEFNIPGNCAGNTYVPASLMQGTGESGQKVFGSGYPKGNWFFSWGTVLSPSVTVGGLPLLSAAYPGAPGNSGGPLFNQAGKVVGVLCCSYPIVPAMSFFTPADQLRAVSKKLPGWNV